MSIDSLGKIINDVMNGKAKTVSPEQTKKINQAKKMYNNGNNKKDVPDNTQKESKETKDTVKIEDYTYKTRDGHTVEGQLHYKKDGSIVFKSSYNGVYEVTFSSQENFDKKLPKMERTANGPISILKKYEYNNNNTLSNVKVTQIIPGEKKEKVLKEEKRDDKGRLVNIKQFDNDGKCKLEVVYTDKDENHRTAVTYDKNHKVTETTEEEYKDGKLTHIKSYDANHNMIRETKYEAGKLSTRNIYKNGKLNQSFEYFSKTGGIKSRTLYDENGKVIQHNEIEATPDGNFGVAAQIGQGDCYLLASINSLRGTDEGHALLKSLIKTTKDASGNKTYTVTLPGAKIAAKSLKDDPNIENGKMYITGTYTFTQEQLNELIEYSGTHYTLGDADVLLLEAAFEQYRKEASKTVKANNLQTNPTQGGLTNVSNVVNILDGGLSFDSTFMLTGKPSASYLPKTQPEAGFDLENLKNGKISISRKNQEMVKAAPREIDGEEVRTKGELDNMLDEIMKKQASGNDTIVATAGFYMMKDGKKIGGHAFTIKKVTADSVTLLNPWNPEKELVISRKEFRDMATSCSYTQLDKKYAIKQEETKKYGKMNSQNSSSKKIEKPKTQNPTPKPQGKNTPKIQGKNTPKIQGKNTPKIQGENTPKIQGKNTPRPQVPTKKPQGTNTSNTQVSPLQEELLKKLKKESDMS